MIRLITDSAADFEPAELKARNITCIPLPVTIGGTEYQENIDLTKDRFYELMEATRDFPKTSQASPRALIDLFEDTAAGGDEALYITLSSGLSGTYQSARMTQAMIGCDRCHVLDSLNASGGQRLLVERAVMLRDEGKTVSQITEALTSLRERIRLYACMDTLEYLYRGGRIRQTTYKLGTLANIKPIISIDREGRVEVPAKAMGMRKGIDCLCKRLEAQQPDPTFPIYVMYTKDRACGEALAQRLAAIGYDIPAERIINVGAAIGSHIGPGACGLVYVESV